MQSKFLILTSLLLLGLGAATSALAHGNEHHGKPIVGYITSTEQDSFKMKGEKAEITVSTSAKAQYTTGDGSEKTEMRPQKGDHVMVYGTTLESGQVVASEVMIHRMAKSDDMDKGGHQSMGETHSMDRGNCMGSDESCNHK